MMATRLVCDDGLRRTEGGFELEIRLPWYRGLPLSTFRELSLQVDGQNIGLEGATLRVNDEIFPLDTLPSRHDKWWFVLDSGYLAVPGTPLSGASVHEVDMTLALEVPYVKSKRMSTRCVKSVREHEGQVN